MDFHELYARFNVVVREGKKKKKPQPSPVVISSTFEADIKHPLPNASNQSLHIVAHADRSLSLSHSHRQKRAEPPEQQWQAAMQGPADAPKNPTAKTSNVNPPFSTIHRPIHPILHTERLGGSPSASTNRAAEAMA